MHRRLIKLITARKGFCALILLLLGHPLYGQNIGVPPIAMTQNFLPVPNTLTVENVPPVPQTYPARWSKYLAGYYVSQSLAGWASTEREILLKEYGSEVQLSSVVYTNSFFNFPIPGGVDLGERRILE